MSIRAIGMAWTVVSIVSALAAAAGGGANASMLERSTPALDDRAAAGCRIDGPRRVRGEVRAGGRVLLQRLLIRCSRSGRVRVAVRSRRSGDRRLGGLRGVTFGVPAGRASRIRLAGRAFVGPTSLRRVLGRRLAVRVTVRWGGSGTMRRRLAVTLRRPSDARRRQSPVLRGAPVGSEGGWPLLGIGDQQPDMFEEALFLSLRVGIARLVVPWNAMSTDHREIEAWLRAARRARVEPLVAFGHARDDECPNEPCRLPSLRSYTAEFRAFRRRFPWVRTITPWNEPNHASQPTVAAPRRAARYYNAVRAACGRCTIVAGDMLDAPNLRGYLARYRSGLSEAPVVWGLHNYFDTTYGRTAGLETMLGAVRGRIWLTETGGIVSSRRSSGRVGLPYDERRAGDAVRRAIAMAGARLHRVTRVYLYEWRTRTEVPFDAGLLRPDGTARAGYRVVRRALRRGSVALRGAGPMALTAAPRRSRRSIRLALRCARRAPRGCLGRATIASAAWSRAPLLNGRAPPRLLAPRSVQFRLGGGERGSVDIRVPRAAARRAGVRLRIALETVGGARAAGIVPLAAPAHL